MTTPFAIGRVRDIMTIAPTCVQRATTIDELLQLFDGHDYNAFPVSDASGELLGIVTKLDLLGALQSRIRLTTPHSVRLKEDTVESIMRRGVVTLDGDDSIDAAAALMLETQLRSIPVIHRASEGPPTLVGIVSRGDVIRGLRFAMNEPNPEDPAHR